MKLEIKNISKSFLTPRQILFGDKKKIQAVQDFSLTLNSGESLGIVGESGSGKTTVAKMAAGFLEPDRGLILFDGINLSQISRKERSSLVQMIFQDPFASLNPKLRLRSQLEEGFKVVHIQNISERANMLMKDVGLSSEFLDRYPHQLSGGQRQRFAVARALTLEPKLLIADEPVSNLDLSVQAQMINLFNRLRIEHHFLQIVISHDLAVIASLCTRVIVMKDGQMVEEGLVADLLSHPRAPYTLQLLEATPVV